MNKACFSTQKLYSLHLRGPSFPLSLLCPRQEKLPHCSSSWPPLFMDSSPPSIEKVNFILPSCLNSMFCNASLTSSVSLTIRLVKWKSGSNSTYAVPQNSSILYQASHCSFFTLQLWPLREFPISVWIYGVHLRFPTWSVYRPLQKLCMLLLLFFFFFFL